MSNSTYSSSIIYRAANAISRLMSHEVERATFEETKNLSRFIERDSENYLSVEPKSNESTDKHLNIYSDDDLFNDSQSNHTKSQEFLKAEIKQWQNNARELQVLLGEIISSVSPTLQKLEERLDDAWDRFGEHNGQITKAVIAGSDSFAQSEFDSPKDFNDSLKRFASLWSVLKSV